MDEDYDIIVLGTGLKECILSGLMSVNGKKVLHIDRNSYYGGESASLNLEQLYKEYYPNQQTIPSELGRNRDYAVDQCPKFIMSCGNLVKILLHTKVTRYLEFKSVAGSYVVQSNKVHKVPATPSEALHSGLLGIFQKRRFKNFLQWVERYDQNNPKTYEGSNAAEWTTQKVFDYWKLDETTQQFTGHAIALEETDNYSSRPALPVIEKLKLYAYSVSRYGNSPYIYPLYGLGGLPEGFSRLSAIHGGTYMLNQGVKEVLYDSTGRVTGIMDNEGKTARCKQLIADPSYFLNTNKVQKTGRIIRCICLLSHPIPDTNDADSCQIIIPYHQIRNRRSDIYIFSVSYHHKVVAEGKWLAVISTNMESTDARTEIQPALQLLGRIDQMFLKVSDYYTPMNDPQRDQCFITSSYDSTSHFESATNEVIELYEKITGKPLDLTIAPDLEQEE